MNQRNNSAPAPPRPPKGRTRWSQSVLESVFTTIAIGAIAVARSLRDGDLFHPENARLLRSAANTVLVGGLAAAAAQIGVSLWFIELADDLPIKFRATGSLLAAVPVALALGGLAEIFRRGAALRDDVEGLV